MIMMSAYRPPTPICVFTQEMSEIITLFEDIPICVMGDFSEDIAYRGETHDSGKLIDHIYTNTKLSVETDVSDCYYSNHDYVLCTINK